MTTRARWRTLAAPVIGAATTAFVAAMALHDHEWTWGALWMTACAMDVHEFVRRWEGGEL